MLSIILTAAVLYPGISSGTMIAILVGGSLAALAAAAILWAVRGGRAQPAEPAADPGQRATWRMPPLSELPPARLSLLNRAGMIVLRAYLIVAGGLVLVRI